MRCMKKMSIIILSIAMVFMCSVMVNADDTVKGVQGMLGYFGYDCGTPDGIMGAKTTEGIKAYQRDMGLEETGEINDELIEYLSSGLPLKLFVSRYNEALDWMAQVVTSDKVKHIDFPEDVETIDLADGIKLSLNPNIKFRKMVGNLNFAVEDKTKTDSDAALLTMIAALYAFNVNDADPGVTMEKINTNGLSGTHDGIEYTDYSMLNIIVIKATYKSFENTSMFTDYVH